MIALLLDPFPRDPSQEEARRELSNDVYRQDESPIQKALDWVVRRISEVLDQASGTEAVPRLAIALLSVVLLVVVIAVLWRFGPLARTRRRAREAEHLEPTVDHDAHRRNADAFAAEGRYAEAVRERLRAIVRSLIDRGVLDNRLGRTATEIAMEAGRKLPAAAVDLLEAASLFGAIWYGGRTATALQDGRMREIDRAVDAARLGTDDGAVPALAGSWAVPSADPDAGQAGQAGLAAERAGQGRP